MDSLSALPKDMLLQILSFLRLKDLGCVSCVNRSLKELTDVDNLWKNLVEKDWTEKKLAIPTNPFNQTWKELYKSKVYFSTFIEGGDNVAINKNVASAAQSSTQMAFGKFHYSGRHKYTVQINNLGYFGVGVASTALSEKEIKGGEILTRKVGCCVFYRSGYWYGWKKGNSNLFSESKYQFNTNEKIEVYFDVDNGKVKYVVGTRTLASCKVIQGYKIEKGLRFAVVLASGGSLTIVDYQTVDQLPTTKMVRNTLRALNPDCIV
eukprot:TRINITY_DN4453_c0_g1_i1.p1 TRINITY_DN4453_c0_g1~~TRINITY_DN4453_c0_g1_i1.p1  ORF type:complete len:264 (-),score=56.72 TRINITY_DN4453_c0_g1_i1:104-895(-)